MLKLLQRQKMLVKRGRAAVSRRGAEAAESGSRGAEERRRAPRRAIDVATFKERFGVTRKFAIPLLEYLDRERVTRRMGETRVVL